MIHGCGVLSVLYVSMIMATVICGCLCVQVAIAETPLGSDGERLATFWRLGPCGSLQEEVSVGLIHSTTTSIHQRGSRFHIGVEAAVAQVRGEGV